MTLARSAAHSVVAMLCAALPGVAAAQSESDSGSALRASAFAAAPHGLSLVELPPEAGMPALAPRRPRHALRVRSGTAEGAMRSLGVAASDCAMLFRVNSHSAGAGSTAVVLKPQMHLNCRF